MMGAVYPWAVGTSLMKCIPWEAPTLVLVGWQFLLGGLPLTLFAIPDCLAMETIFLRA